MTDSLALERYAATQDAEAFAHLVQRYGQMVYATCLRTLRHVDDAEDASQDTFVQLAKSAGEVRSSLGAWLHRTAVNVSISRLRSDGRRGKREAAVATAERVGDATDAAEWAEIRAAVDDVLAAMPEEERGWIVQRYLVGRTQADLATEHGVSASMMSRKVNAAVEELRARLRKRGVLAGAGVATLVSGLSAEAAVPMPAELAARLVTPGLAGIPLSVAAAVPGGAGVGLWSLPIKLSTAVLGSLVIHGLILGAYLVFAGSGAPESEVEAPTAPRETTPATSSSPLAGEPIRVTSEEQAASDAEVQSSAGGFVFLMSENSMGELSMGARKLPDQGTLTLLEFLASAGVVDEFHGRDVQLLRRAADGEPEPPGTLRWDDPEASAARGVVLRANDIVNLSSATISMAEAESRRFHIQPAAEE